MRFFSVVVCPKCNAFQPTSCITQVKCLKCQKTTTFPNLIVLKKNLDAAQATRFVQALKLKIAKKEYNKRDLMVF